MILPNDILIRATSDGQTVWVSQRMVCVVGGVDENSLKVLRARYKSSLRASWQSVTSQDEFFLGDNPSKSWRWGRKGGRYYYDYDRIPDRKPTCYRSLLPSKEELIGAVEGQNLRGSRERQAEQRRIVLERIEQCTEAADFRFFADFAIGDKSIFNQSRTRALSRSAAWCRFLKYVLMSGGHIELGFASQAYFLSLCTELIAAEGNDGLRIKSSEALRRKITSLPDDGDAMLAALVSGKYCNDNRRIIGKIQLVDTHTGEVFKCDAHEATIMTYWLNPGQSQKDSKRSLYDLYAYDMECLNIAPAKLSTFVHYIGCWDRQYLSAAERHGKSYAKNAFRPYVPSQPLEFANSLWVSDGSGVVPYRYQDQHGKWRMMKLYTMLVTDVASRYMAGYAVSRKGEHIEDAKMLRNAMRMALGKSSAR